MSDKIFRSALIAAAIALSASASARAEVTIDVNIAKQTMHVESSEGAFDWPVSTARAGFTTPRGHFAPTGLERMHYSKKYHNSPMPYSIFFLGGYAIHGTDAVASLGRPASHGCVRLSPRHAKQLFEMVQREGARIAIDSAPTHVASR
jgi:lipoprotein-anchoring transpeptidase ErfK/SrfK